VEKTKATTKPKVSPLLPHNHTNAHMALPTAAAALEDDANWAVERATGFPEVWALGAENGDGLVDAWRLTSVCRATRAGVTTFLSTLAGLVVCGGYSQGGGQGVVSEVWRLDLATLRWEPMPALLTARSSLACRAVRGTLVVLGGSISLEALPISSEVEMLSSGAFVNRPPLSRGGIDGAAAIEVDESDSAAGQLLLLGGQDGVSVLPTVYLVDLATGACARQPDLLHSRADHAAARLPDGRIIRAGGFDATGAYLSSLEVWGPPAQGGPDASWTWIELPAMSAGRSGCCGCVMSDGRFAVLVGYGMGSGSLSSCEALVMGAAAHWEPLPPMHDAQSGLACAAVAGCVIVAGGAPGRTLAEVYDESRNRWLRLPNGLSYENELWQMGSALL
jgi:hypothetical protein